MIENYEYDPEFFRIRWICRTSVESQVTSLRGNGFTCTEMGHCLSKNDFLESLRVSLNLPCEKNLLTSWDSASDFFWEAMMSQSSSKVAIFWDGVDLLIDSKLHLLTKCLEFLVSAAEVVERQALTSDCHPVLVHIYLVGTGRNFPTFDSMEVNSKSVS